MKGQNWGLCGGFFDVGVGGYCCFGGCGGFGCFCCCSNGISRSDETSICGKKALYPFLFVFVVTNIKNLVRINVLYTIVM